ncbi:TIGR03750 family conjugal transfer protein [Xenorhabdus japonica]|uniref:Conjugative transfer region protein, TIGR03750 family n=1 Tax=Xenorhabdus japonica TaxID=53341 RepID=A0A1I5BVW1_9GAMM|nr:TIGR03750 family conjugal transfer protein [Xenorhabdus japonica]SFN78784.1 conjugative transfer region protein, TIGR03750 family [Xenorhabdus japonica]
MQTIAFLPDRLNAEPVVFRGFTTPEMGLAALAGITLGLAVSIPLIPLTGWVMLPTGMLVMPLLLVSFGGRWLAHLKRGKPENYIWLKLAEKKRRLGIGDPAWILTAQGWSLRRSRSLR